MRIGGHGGNARRHRHALNELANEALRDPKVRDQITALDYDIRGGSAKEFAEFIALDINRYKKLAADMGLAED